MQNRYDQHKQHRVLNLTEETMHHAQNQQEEPTQERPELDGTAEDQENLHSLPDYGNVVSDKDITPPNLGSRSNIGSGDTLSKQIATASIRSKQLQREGVLSTNQDELKELRKADIDDDEFRQRIEKETLDKILNQEIVEYEGEPDHRIKIMNHGDKDKALFPHSIRAISGKLREESKMGDKIVIPDTQPKNEVTPRYRQHTVESQLKDLRLWSKSPLNLGPRDIEFIKKKNPNYFFHIDERPGYHQTTTPVDPSQLILLPPSALPEETGRVTTNEMLSRSPHTVQYQHAEIPIYDHQMSTGRDVNTIRRAGGDHTKKSGGSLFSGTDPATKRRGNQETTDQQAEEPTVIVHQGLPPYKMAEDGEEEIEEHLSSLPHPRTFKPHLKGSKWQRDSMGRMRKKRRVSKKGEVTMFVGPLDPAGKKSLSPKSTLEDDRRSKGQRKSLKKKKIELSGIGADQADYQNMTRTLNPPGGLQQSDSNAQHLRGFSKGRVATITHVTSEFSAFQRESRESKKVDDLRASGGLKRKKNNENDFLEMLLQQNNETSIPLTQVQQEQMLMIQEQDYLEISRNILNSVRKDNELLTTQKTLPLSTLGDHQSNMRGQMRQLKQKFKRQILTSSKEEGFDRMKQGKSCSVKAVAQLSKTPPPTKGAKKRADDAWSDFSSGRKSQRARQRFEQLKKKALSQNRKFGGPSSKSRTLLGLQADIKAMHPKSQRDKVDFEHIDMRGTIEKHNQMKSVLFKCHKETEVPKRRLTQSRGKSESPRATKVGNDFYNVHSTNLKILTTNNHSGNIEDRFSYTTQIISGHNSPLTYLRKRREKYLNQINRDQDELMERLKEKERRLALKSLKAHRIFHSFVSNMEQTDMPDEESYARLQNTIKQARQSMFNTKMRPLQSTKSFHSWRSGVERRIDEGFTYSEQKDGYRMPRRFSKHLKEVRAKRALLGLDLSSQHTSIKRSLIGSQVSESGFDDSGVTTPARETLYRKFGDSHLKPPEQATLSQGKQLNLLQADLQPIKEKIRASLEMKSGSASKRSADKRKKLQQMATQEALMDKNFEEEANQFFTEEPALQKDESKIRRRNILLERVRQKLKEKVKSELLKNLLKQKVKIEQSDPKNSDALSQMALLIKKQQSSIQPEGPAVRKMDTVSAKEQEKINAFNRDRGGIDMLRKSQFVIAKQRDQKGSTRNVAARKSWGSVSRKSSSKSHQANSTTPKRKESIESVPRLSSKHSDPWSRDVPRITEEPPEPTVEPTIRSQAKTSDLRASDKQPSAASIPKQATIATQSSHMEEKMMAQGFQVVQRDGPMHKTREQILDSIKFSRNWEDAMEGPTGDKKKGSKRKSRRQSSLEKGSALETGEVIMEEPPKIRGDTRNSTVIQGEESPLQEFQESPAEKTAQAEGISSEATRANMFSNLTNNEYLSIDAKGGPHLMPSSIVSQATVQATLSPKQAYNFQTEKSGVLSGREAEQKGSIESSQDRSNLIKVGNSEIKAASPPMSLTSLVPPQHYRQLSHASGPRFQTIAEQTSTDYIPQDLIYQDPRTKKIRTRNQTSLTQAVGQHDQALLSHLLDQNPKDGAHIRKMFNNNQVLLQRHQHFRNQVNKSIAVEQSKNAVGEFERMLKMQRQLINMYKPRTAGAGDLRKLKSSTHRQQMHNNLTLQQYLLHHSTTRGKPPHMSTIPSQPHQKEDGPLLSPESQPPRGVVSSVNPSDQARGGATIFDFQDYRSIQNLSGSTQKQKPQADSVSSGTLGGQRIKIETPFEHTGEKIKRGKVDYSQVQSKVGEIIRGQQQQLQPSETPSSFPNPLKRQGTLSGASSTSKRSLEQRAQNKSMWKENFAMRKKMGYDQYRRLSTVHKTKIETDIQSKVKKALRAQRRLRNLENMDAHSRIFSRKNFSSSSSSRRLARYQTRVISPAGLEIEAGGASIGPRGRGLSGQHMLTSSFQGGQASDKTKGQYATMNSPNGHTVYSSFDQGYQRLLSADNNRPIPEKVVKTRKVKKFAQVERTAKIPVRLKNYYSYLARKTDSQQEAQVDFVELNKTMLNDPWENVKMTEHGRMLHEFREVALQNDRLPTEEEEDEDKESKAIRQCDCHARLKPQLAGENVKERAYIDGLIHLRKRKLTGVNAREHQALREQSNIRLKSFSAVTRTERERLSSEVLFDKFEAAMGSGQAETLAQEKALLEKQLRRFTLDKEEEVLDNHLNLVKHLQPLQVEGPTSQPKSRSRVFQNHLTCELSKFVTQCHSLQREFQHEIKDRDSAHNQEIAQLKGISKKQEKLGKALTKYIDMEKVQNTENQKELMQRAREEEQLKQQQLERRKSIYGVPMMMSHRGDKSSKSPKKQRSSSQMFNLPKPVAKMASDKLLSLKEIYIDMIRNQQLDYENFMEPKIIQKCIDQKNKTSLQVCTKYTRKIWKPNYSRIVPKIVRNACNFEVKTAKQ